MIPLVNTNDEVTIDDLEAQDAKAPIWVLNSSAQSRARMSGEVHIGIPKPNGTKVDDLFLPMTWLPIRITDQIPRRQLLDASEFRNAVNSRVMELISAERAKKILAEDGAEEERDRLEARQRQIDEAQAARGIQGSGAEIVSVQELSENNKTMVESETVDPNALDSGFLMFVEAIKQDTDVEALNRIRARAKFSTREVEHMLKELRSKDRVCTFLKTKLAEMRG